MLIFFYQMAQVFSSINTGICYFFASKGSGIRMFMGKYARHKRLDFNNTSSKQSFYSLSSRYIRGPR